MKDMNVDQQTETKVSTWWIFAGFGLLFLLYGIYVFTLPYLQPSHWNYLIGSEETVAYIADNFKWLGMISTIVGTLTVGISFGGFRLGQRWAWFTLASFPIFFLMAIPFTWLGLLWSPLLIASVVGLWLSYSPIFERR